MTEGFINHTNVHRLGACARFADARLLHALTLLFSLMYRNLNVKTDLTLLFGEVLTP